MSNPTADKPKAHMLPNPDRWSKPFWEHCHQGHLALQRCDGCGSYRYPAGPVCPHCLSPQFQWAAVSGRGTVQSWVVFHQVYYPDFDNPVPYNVIMVQLEEGPSLISNLEGVPNEEIRIGMPVEVTFEPLNDVYALPRFRPIQRQ